MKGYRQENVLSMRLHLNKPGIRALGVAESFKQGEKRSILAGVVMRSDMVIDGIAFGRTSVGGDDATASIFRLYKSLHRNDVNLVMVSGAILSLYNIIDVDKLRELADVPVVCLTYKETAGIAGSIRRHFPGKAEKKLEAYRRLGSRTRVVLGSGHAVFARGSGLDTEALTSVVRLFTLQGSIPEPVRVAKLLARAAALRKYSA